MLIRLPNDSIRDMPDEIGALLLSDPSHDDDISDFTGQDVNVVIHGILASYFEDTKSFEEIIEEIRTQFLKFGPAKDEKVRIATDLIKKYNIEIKNEEIGMVNPHDMFQFAPSRPEIT
jgi:hypothetical protein